MEHQSVITYAFSLSFFVSLILSVYFHLLERQIEREGHKKRLRKRKMFYLQVHFPNSCNIAGLGCLEAHQVCGVASKGYPLLPFRIRWQEAGLEVLWPGLEPALQYGVYAGFGHANQWFSSLCCSTQPLPSIVCDIILLIFVCKFACLVPLVGLSDTCLFRTRTKADFTFHLRNSCPENLLDCCITQFV